jgi:uncharacterized RDD family membrane protein YckC
VAEEPRIEALNPFEPPKEDADVQPRKRRRRRSDDDADEDYLVDARPRTRFTNYVVDFALYAMLVAAAELDDAFVASYAIHFVYYCGFETVTGKSPAKWLTQTRVITLDGVRPPFGAVLKRSIIRLIPFEPFSFLGSGRGWHDRWSGTRVVYERDAGRRHAR